MTTQAVTLRRDENQARRLAQYALDFMSGNYKRAKNDIGRIVANLEAKLAQYPGDQDLANAEDWL